MIGLDYCHQRGVVNRDVKLNNMLVQVGARRLRFGVHYLGFGFGLCDGWVDLCHQRSVVIRMVNIMLVQVGFTLPVIMVDHLRF
jgi:serine/threonine protein kinase